MRGYMPDSTLGYRSKYTNAMPESSSGHIAEPAAVKSVCERSMTAPSSRASPASMAASARAVSSWLPTFNMSQNKVIRWHCVACMLTYADVC